MAQRSQEDGTIRRTSGERRLLARRCGLSNLNDDENAELLRSIDEAERDIDEGRS